MISLGAILGGGLGLAFGWDDPDGKALTITGGALAAGGIVLVAIGGIRSSIGKAKIRKAVNLYNNGRMYSQGDIDMEYGLGGNGVYLTFLF